MTHQEYRRTKLTVSPCTAHDQTFEGRCLNCGYDPFRIERVLSQAGDAVRERLGIK